MENNNLDKFEGFVRDSIQSQEAPFNEAHWEDMSQSLKQLNKPKRYTRYLTAAAAILVVVAGAYLISSNDTPTAELSNNDTEKKATTNEPIVEHTQNTPETNEVNPIPVSTENSTPETVTAQEGITHTTETPNPVEDVTFTLEKNELSQLQDIDTSRIVVDEIALKPIAEITASRTESCEGVIISFKTPDNPKQVGYFWDFGDGTISREQNPSHDFTKPGNYTIHLSAINGDLHTHTTLEAPIVIHKKPEANFAWKIDKTTTTPIVQLTNLTDGARDIKWDLDDNTKTTIESPSHVYARKGSYVVNLVVTDEHNCSSTISKTIDIKQTINLLAPTGFSPDGDGQNDYFIPKALEINDYRFSMKIYDARHKLVFETTDKNQPWDGRSLGGGIDDGTYVWFVELTNKYGEEEVHNGTITIATGR